MAWLKVMEIGMRRVDLKNAVFADSDDSQESLGSQNEATFYRKCGQFGEPGPAMFEASVTTTVVDRKTI